jgi:hypothetical protein
MEQKSLSPILIAIAMVLVILNYDFSNEVGNRKFWILVFSLITLAASIILIIKNQSSEK